MGRFIVFYYTHPHMAVLCLGNSGSGSGSAPPVTCISRDPICQHGRTPDLVSVRGNGPNIIVSTRWKHWQTLRPLFKQVQKCTGKKSLLPVNQDKWFFGSIQDLSCHLFINRATTCCCSWLHEAEPPCWRARGRKEGKRGGGGERRLGSHRQEKGERGRRQPCPHIPMSPHPHIPTSPRPHIPIHHSMPLAQPHFPSGIVGSVRPSAKVDAMHLYFRYSLFIRSNLCYLFRYHSVPSMYRVLSLSLFFF